MKIDRRTIPKNRQQMKRNKKCSIYCYGLLLVTQHSFVFCNNDTCHLRSFYILNNLHMKKVVIHKNVKLTSSTLTLHRHRPEFSVIAFELVAFVSVVRLALAKVLFVTYLHRRLSYYYYFQLNLLSMTLMDSIELA